MGRHSSAERGAYVRSVLGWALPWIVIAAIVGVAVWFAVSAVGGDAARVANTSSDTSPSSEPTRKQAPSPTPAQEPASEEVQPDRERDPRGKLITQGITVQVLNGTGGIANAATTMADRLASLGFQIQAIQTGLTTDQTVVYYSNSDARPAAEALARRFGWGVGQAPDSLSNDIDLHVVVSPADA